MSFRQPHDGPRVSPRSCRAASRRRALRGLLAAVFFLIPAGPICAEDKVLVQGLFEAEVWKTDDASFLLSKNEGETAPAGRLRLWTIGEFRPRLQGFALGRLEEGRGSYEEDGESVLDLAVVRYTFEAPRRLIIEGGKILTPIGNFARRYLSSTNPLIGYPDSYDVAYPYGIQVSGQVSRLDYRVAAIDRPMVNDAYTPKPGSAVRPALALGVTPVTGLRIGVYSTRGPYLGPDIEEDLPAGTTWKDFGQMITGADLQFSRGHFELNADYAASTYEAPTSAFKSRGRAYFVEPKFTFSPRFFTAMRVEKNDYPYIMPLFGGLWIVNNSELFDVEAGAGYRIGPGAILKVAYRRDYWNVPEASKSFFSNGYSVSAQLTYSFSVNSWLERPR
ncbi:MAG TPA: hypothetical protein VGV60_06150 [Candidatus Polarisedimenticolia bacterium]|jgi:hypothetical protein|nr:hypothetical protein [Candidatus Polarisedimenticolia bacterium]